VRIVGVADDDRERAVRTFAALKAARSIAALARWRAANEFAYPTRFEGTATWLRDRVLNVPDRIMFLVHDPAGRVVDARPAR
jgi:hypothetical protein